MNKLLDQFQTLHQGSMSGFEYISKFEELMLSFDMDEDPKVSLSDSGQD